MHTSTLKSLLDLIGNSDTEFLGPSDICSSGAKCFCLSQLVWELGLFPMHIHACAYQSSASKLHVRCIPRADRAIIY